MPTVFNDKMLTLIFLDAWHPCNHPLWTLPNPRVTAKGDWERKSQSSGTPLGMISLGNLPASAWDPSNNQNFFPKLTQRRASVPTCAKIMKWSTVKHHLKQYHQFTMTANRLGNGSLMIDDTNTIDQASWMSLVLHGQRWLILEPTMIKHDLGAQKPSLLTGDYWPLLTNHFQLFTIINHHWQ